MTSKLDINRAWNAIRVLLQQECSFYTIKDVVGLAGLNLSDLSHLEQKAGGGASKGQLMTAIDRSFSRLPAADKKKFLSYVAEGLLERSPDSEEALEGYLARFGWGLAGTSVVPLNIIDASDLEEISDESKHDLIKAAQRLRDGDLSGAVSAACGAVDTCTTVVYEDYDLGNPGEASFQERCKKSLDALGVISSLESQLCDIGWNQDRIKPLQNNLQGSLNQGAYVMQSLRSNMGDVHGTKPFLKTLVLDCIKWAELMVRTLEGK